MKPGAEPHQVSFVVGCAAEPPLSLSSYYDNDQTLTFLSSYLIL